MLVVFTVLAVAAWCRADDTAALLDEISRTAAATAPAERVDGMTAAPADAWATVVFFLPTVACAAAVGVCGASLGTFVLRRGEAVVALALPQSVMLGAAVGLRLGVPELPPAALAVAVTLLVFAVERPRPGGGRRGPSRVPAVYVSALCLAFVVVAGAGQFVERLQNLFTGIDVAVTPGQAIVVAPTLVVVGLAVAALWRRWLLVAQLPAVAGLAGVSVLAWDALFLAALSLYVLLGTAGQGVVLVLAMLFIPPTVAGPWATRLPTAVALAVAAAVAMAGLGFAASNAFAWPFSHSAGAVGFALMLVSQAAAALAPSPGMAGRGLG